jgi:hypothetical protein
MTPEERLVELRDCRALLGETYPGLGDPADAEYDRLVQRYLKIVGRFIAIQRLGVASGSVPPAPALLASAMRDKERLAEIARRHPDLAPQIATTFPHLFAGEG